MGDSLTTQMLRADAELPCPACGYQMWARWSEIVVETIIRCPCCRRRVQLRDERAGAAVAAAEAESMIADMFKNM